MDRLHTSQEGLTALWDENEFMDQENDSLGILCVGIGAKETYLVSLTMPFISHVMGGKFLIFLSASHYLSARGRGEWLGQS